ncbi:hypothetical protein SteCoe_30651 [Stentor coeruleus]|uniref:dual-specificity kinase n=1 Tax=Stentor coeruleus TaxID=5963 RepID=A0A1R2B348_9CILI|nr:hypothetical protein SteCoe_30651 [Stentor coeruleus]
MKANLNLKTKEPIKKLNLEPTTPKHKYTTSFLSPVSLISTSDSTFSLSPKVPTTQKIPQSTKSKPSFSSFLSPNTSKNTLNPKHNHAVSHQFPINPASPRPVKTPYKDHDKDKIMWNSLEFPLTPEEVLKNFKQHLTQDEYEEILSFSEIFFIGIGVKKIEGASLRKKRFDDEEYNYRVTIGDHIAYRYEILQILGSGSFGKVVKVLDHKSKQYFAMKIIKNQTRFHEQARDEIEILNYLKSHDPDKSYCIIHFIDHIQFRNHICLIFELLYINLYQFIKLNNYQSIPMNRIKKFALQILQALRLLDRYKVIHCDLKPENILLRSSDSIDIKVIDFGSACFYDKRIYTYIQSRFYRAPEVILGLEYSTAIDMWSFGCILIEMFTGKPIFPGENEMELLQCMMEVLGSPPLKVISKAVRRNLYFEADGRPKIQANTKGRKRIPNSRPIKDIIRRSEDGFQELILQCFEWDQNKRITPDEALLLPWFSDSNELFGEKQMKV